MEAWGQLGVDPLTAVSLKPPPPEASLQKNIPTYPASVFSEMPEGSREKKGQKHAPGAHLALGYLQYAANPGLPSPLGLRPGRGKVPPHPQQDASVSAARGIPRHRRH